MSQESEYQILYDAWRSRRSDEDFNHALARVLEIFSNPYDALITLVAHSDKPKQADFLKKVLSGFSALLPRSNDRIHPPALRIKENAFHVFVSNLRVRGEALAQVCSIFRFADSKDDLYWKVREIFERQNYGLGSALVVHLQLFDRFDAEDIFVRLLLADQVQILEQFVESRPDLQRRLLKMLDFWIAMTDVQIAQHCRRISPNLDSLETTSVDFARVKQRAIKKVASRLAAKDRFNLCDDMTVCRNLYFDKFHSYLNNVVLDFVAQRVDEVTFHDLVDPIVDAASDPSFPRHALIVIKKLVTCSEVRINMIERMCNRWKLSIADVVSICPSLDNLRRDDESTSVVNSSPYLRFPLPTSSVSIISSKLAFRDAVSCLMRHHVIAFDAEYHFSLPVFHPGSVSRGHSGAGIALLQLAVDDRVFILDVSALMKPEESADWWFLGRLFTDPDKVKLGFGFQSDLTLISRSIPKLAPHLQRRVNCIDLETVVENFESLVNNDGREACQKSSLAKIVKQFLGQSLDKSVQRSNWDLRPLRPKQIDYAALDAHVLLSLYDEISERVLEAGIEYRVSDLALKDFEDEARKATSTAVERTVRVISKGLRGSSENGESGPLRQYAFGRGSALPGVRVTEDTMPVGLSRLDGCSSSSGSLSRLTSSLKKLSFGRGSNVTFMQ